MTKIPCEICGRPFSLRRIQAHLEDHRQAALTAVHDPDGEPSSPVLPSMDLLMETEPDEGPSAPFDYHDASSPTPPRQSLSPPDVSMEDLDFSEPMGGEVHGSLAVHLEDWVVLPDEEEQPSPDEPDEEDFPDAALEGRRTPDSQDSDDEAATEALRRAYEAEWLEQVHHLREFFLVSLLTESDISYRPARPFG